MSLDILYVTGSLYAQGSGPWLSLLQTVQEMGRKGHRPLVIGSKDDRSQGKPVAWQPVPAQAFWKIGPYSLHFTPGLWRWLKQRNQLFDMVSLQSIWLYNNYMASQWCMKHHIPYMITAHGNFNPVALQISKRKKQIARFWFLNKMLTGARCIQALTRSEYEAIRDYGIKTPVCVIPNGIYLPPSADMVRLRSGLTEEEARSVGGRRICLFLGRLHPIKGLKNLIQSWAELKTFHKEWILVVAGPDDHGYRKLLEQKVADLQLEKNVFFAGPQYDNAKVAWLRASEVFVLPSLSEGFPMILLEASAYGLPLVITDACNFPEAMIEGAAFSASSAENGLTEALQRMFTLSNSKRLEMGQLGRSLVEDRFQWTHIVDQLTEVYHWMLGKREPPSFIFFN